ncbi:MAG: ribulose-phosphate 3-epimerase [Ignavibacteria bacterium]
MKLIAPSLLACNFLNLSQQIRSVEKGSADLLHCDIMDGHFVPNITFGTFIVKAVKKIAEVPLDCHLMISNPDNYLEDFVKAGAEYITVHQEAVIHMNRTISRIRELAAKPGVAINPATPVSTLENIVEFVDMILIMSVNPGFGGQSFIESSLRKISQAAELREKLGLKFLIEADGGIDSDNIKRVSDAGCDVFVAGSGIYKYEDITAKTAELKNIVNL